MATGQKVTTTAVCRQLGYSKQAYYKSLKTGQRRDCYEPMVVSKVLAIREFLPKLGGRKLYHLLKEELIKKRIAVGRDQLFGILKRHRLLVRRKRKYAVTTNSNHWMRRYPNLIKGFTPCAPEQLCVADITYLEMDNGFSYLHLVTDAYSKKIVGYELSSNLSATHTMKALQMAIDQRKTTEKMIHHSDRGLQYCSTGYVELLTGNDIAISMTQDGSPYDNAIAERINGILKSEFGMDRKFASLQTARKAAVEAIYIYNQYRPHLSCSMLTPNQMHQQRNLPVKAWHKIWKRTLDSSFPDFLPSHYS